MVQIDVLYNGNLRCTSTHAPTGETLQTDAPIDNEGLGATFSPTDLLATALTSCIATIMGIHAKRHNISLEGMSLTVEKHMCAAPRRIGRLPIIVAMPSGIDLCHRESLEASAKHCPVHSSLHPDIEVSVQFNYPVV